MAALSKKARTTASMLAAASMPASPVSSSRASPPERDQSAGVHHPPIRGVAGSAGVELWIASPGTDGLFFAKWQIGRHDAPGMGALRVDGDARCGEGRIGKGSDRDRDHAGA